MPNIRFVLEYDGSGFCGWQKQPGLRSIEGELQRAIETVLRLKIDHVTAAGRTDSGVHARGQVVNFRVPELPDLSRLQRGVSALLRRELAVLSAEVVPDTFHARFSACRKQYSYSILHRQVPPVLERGRVWFVALPLDVPAMMQAASELIGERDFSSFRGANCTQKSPVKEIFESAVTVHGEQIVYRVVGSGFLKQMVRNIVGTLVAIGKGQARGSMREILEARDRGAAGMTAPAYGLCLDWVSYDESAAAGEGAEEDE